MQKKELPPGFLANWKPLTMQQAFDKALAGVRAQGYTPSVHPDSTLKRCAYRGIHGRKCTIGHCIPDELYLPEMDGDHKFSASLPSGVKMGLSAQEVISLIVQNFGVDLIDPSEGPLSHGDAYTSIHLIQRAHDGLVDELKVNRKSSFEGSMSKFAERFRLVYTPPAKELANG